MDIKGGAYCRLIGSRELVIGVIVSVYVVVVKVNVFNNRLAAAIETILDSPMDIS